MGGLKSMVRARSVTSGPPQAEATAAWALALARAARDAARLDLAVTDCRVTEVSLAEWLDMPPDLSLVVMLSGPCEALGVLVLSPPVLAGLVEWQTLGRVLPQVPPPRRPTRTDAVLAQGIVDRALAGLAAAVDGTDDMTWASGFHYASCLEDARALALILDDAPYRVFAADVALAGSTRSGPVLLALPAEGRVPPPPPPRDGLSDAAQAMVFQTALAEQVHASRVVLDAVIARVSLPLSRILALGPGEVLRLPGATLDRIDLEAPGTARTGGGRLGQAQGMRAVRVRDTSAPVPHTEADLVPGVALVEEAMRRTGTG